jgi:hypothetical protein
MPCGWESPKWVWRRSFGARGDGSLLQQGLVTRRGLWSGLTSRLENNCQRLECQSQLLVTAGRRVLGYHVENIFESREWPRSTHTLGECSRKLLPNTSVSKDDLRACYAEKNRSPQTLPKRFAFWILWHSRCHIRKQTEITVQDFPKTFHDVWPCQRRKGWCYVPPSPPGKRKLVFFLFTAYGILLPNWSIFS